MDFTQRIEHLDPVATQTSMEITHANFRQRPLLVAHFNELFPNRDYPTNLAEEDKEARDEYRSYQKTRRLAINITAMVCLYRRLPLEALVNLFKHEDSQFIADIATALTRSNWIYWDPSREEFVTSQLPTELERQVFDKRYPMPMLCRPRHLNDEEDSPYLTESKSQSVLGEYSGQVTNLATLNALNRIPLRLNQAVLKNTPDTFKEDHKFRQDSAQVFDRIKDEQIYLTWQFDFRGRVYSRGYHVNPQGDDFHKHVIQFGER